MSRKLATIDLFMDTAFDDTYKHVVNWNDQQELDNYLNGLPGKLTITGSYQNINKPIRWDSKIASYNELVNYTYLRITNTDTNDKVKNYYGFITNIEYVNDGTIYIYYSIDMFNTYKWNIDYKSAMIERGFCKEYLDDFSDWSDEFRDVRNNEEPIGGDGAEHLIVSDLCNFTKVKDSDNYIVDGIIKFILITAQPQDVATDPGSFLALFSQYKYYLMAFNTESQEMLSIFDKDGKQLLNYGDNGKDVYEVYQELSKDKNFAGSSSLVVDSEILDYVGFDFEAVTTGHKVTGVQFKKDFKYTAKANYLIVDNANKKRFSTQDGYFQPLSDKTGSLYKRLHELIQERYGQKLQTNRVPFKILANPYTKLTFSDGKGNMILLDLFKFNHLKDEYVAVYRWGGITENTKVAYSFGSYNRAKTNDQGNLITYENSLMIDDSPKDMPIILDNYTMYLNSNKNQLANSRANAKMSLQLAKEGNQNNLDNMNRSINASNRSWAIQKNAQTDNFYEGQAIGIGKNLFNSGAQILSGNIASGLTGAVFGGIDSAHQMASYNRSLTAEKASRAVEQGAQKENARVNYAFNNKVASNNYEQFIRSQNAMLADVKNHNDVIAHQGTNAQWDQQNKNNALHGQIFFSQDSVMLNAGLYFLLFGYTIKRYAKITDYTNRKNVFNYLQTSNANVAGAVAQPVLNTFNAMFDSGVTLWNSTKLNKFRSRDYSYNEFA